MTRTLIKIGLLLVGNALGLWVASLLLDKMNVDGAAFVLAVIIFTVADVVLEPFIRKVTSERVPVLESGTVVITTFLALLVTDLISDGLSIEGVGTWVLATLIVWLLAMLFGVILLKLFVKESAKA